MRPSCFANQRNTSSVTASPGSNTRDGVAVQLAGMNAEGEDIEKDAEPSAPMNYAGDRDESVLVGHRMSHVRTIHALSSEIFFSVGAVPYGSQP